jgi:hypothetical protein
MLTWFIDEERRRDEEHIACTTPAQTRVMYSPMKELARHMVSLPDTRQTSEESLPQNVRMSNAGSSRLDACRVICPWHVYGIL